MDRVIELFVLAVTAVAVIVSVATTVFLGWVVYELVNWVTSK